MERAAALMLKFADPNEESKAAQLSDVIRAASSTQPDTQKVGAHKHSSKHIAASEVHQDPEHKPVMMASTASTSRVDGKHSIKPVMASTAQGFNTAAGALQDGEEDIHFFCFDAIADRFLNGAVIQYSSADAFS